MSKILITLGVLFIIIGIIYPFIVNLGFGKLPGDIVIKKENFNLYFPITSAIILSVIISVVLKLFR